MSKKTSTASDIRHIREELSLTTHAIALSLVERTGSRRVLGELADDLVKLAARLRQQASGRVA